MRYYVALAGRELVVEVGPDGVSVDGRPVPFELERVEGTPLVRAVGEGRSRTVLVEPPGWGDAVEGGWILHLAGERIAVRVEDERRRRLRELVATGGADRVGERIVAPMPGLVLRLEVAVGDVVEVGTGIVVLEAMKMENEIRASRPGVVSAVHVAPGQTVEKNAALVEIAPEGPESPGTPAGPH